MPKLYKKGKAKLITLPPPLIQQTVTATTLNTRQRTIPAMASCEEGQRLFTDGARMEREEFISI